MNPQNQNDTPQPQPENQLPVQPVLSTQPGTSPQPQYQPKDFAPQQQQFQPQQYQGAGQPQPYDSLPQTQPQVYGQQVQLDAQSQPLQQIPPQGDHGLHYIIPLNTSGVAIAAGYVALFSILIIPAPIAIILGVLGLREVKKHPGLHGKFRSLFAIAAGGTVSLFVAVLAIFF
ncbi:hypothetical protein H7097_01085 [Aeromicrobium sp.]|nr:hypothetical protein [Candidatus Saccharibacteria bacterium]